MNISSLYPSTQTLIFSLGEQLGSSLTTRDKKVVLLVSAIFLAMSILFVAYSYYNSKLKILPLKTYPSLDPEEELNILLLQRTSEILQGFKMMVKIHHIQSVKFFTEIKDGHSTDKKEYTIIKEDRSCFDKIFLDQELDSMVDDIKESVDIGKDSHFDVSMQAVIKDKDGEFYHVFITNDYESGHAAVSSGKIQEYWDLVMGDKQPLLDDQNEFI